MKKNVIYIVCGVLIAVALAALLIFVFSGDKTPEQPTVDLKGTWKVVAYMQNGTATIIDNEFMVFDDTSVKDYRDQKDTAFATSTYTLDETLMLNLPDIGRQYKVKKMTENYVCFYENENVCLELIRATAVDMNPAKPELSGIEGRWEIVYRNTSNPFAGEVLAFENGQLSHYKAGSNTPAATSNYEWAEDGTLNIVLWGKQMRIYPMADGNVIMVELAVDTGFVWELKKVAE
jgi:hypothetical protein